MECYVLFHKLFFAFVTAFFFQITFTTTRWPKKRSIRGPQSVVAPVCGQRPPPAVHTLYARIVLGNPFLAGPKLIEGASSGRLRGTMRNAAGNDCRRAITYDTHPPTRPPTRPTPRKATRRCTLRRRRRVHDGPCNIAVIVYRPRTGAPSVFSFLYGPVL